MKTIIFIGCIILVFITNHIWYRRGLIRGIKYSLDRTYDVFMQAMYIKLRRDNKSEEEANEFMHEVHNLLNTASDKVL